MDVHVHQASDQEESNSFLPIAHAHEHDKHNLVFESWSFNTEKPLKRQKFTHLMDNLSPDIIRSKGFVYWDDPKDPLILLNQVGKWVDFEVYFRKENVPLKTRLVFIGKTGWKRNFDIEGHLTHVGSGAGVLLTGRPGQTAP